MEWACLSARGYCVWWSWVITNRLKSGEENALYIQKSARLYWGKTEGYRCHAVPLRISCSFNNDGMDLWVWLQILQILAVESICYCSLGFLLPLPGCKGCAITKRQFLSVWLLHKITHQKDMDVLWFTRNSRANFPVQKKKKIFYLKNCEHLSVSLSISLLIGGPQPSGWMSGK